MLDEEDSIFPGKEKSVVSKGNVRVALKYPLVHKEAWPPERLGDLLVILPHAFHLRRIPFALEVRLSFGLSHR